MNWLPLCGEVDGLVANRGLFEQYHIPMPTDYDSLVAACQAFEKVGIRGFVADFAYDYTCMEVLRGLSIPEITSMEGRIWRSAYEDPTNETVTGLDAVIWPEFIIRLALRLQSEPRTVEKMKQLEGLKALVVDDDFNTCKQRDQDADADRNAAGMDPVRQGSGASGQTVSGTGRALHVG